MAWNRASEAPKVTPKKRPSTLRGLIAGVVCAGLAATVAFFVLSGKDERPKVTFEKEAGLIKEVQPASVKAKSEDVVEPKNVVEYRKVGKNSLMKYIDGQKAWQYPREDYHGPVYTSATIQADTIVEKTFKHEADKIIAELVMIDPGEMVVGEIEFDDGFVKRFLASYESPFIIEPDDTEEQKALKRSVAEIKGELRQRMDEGEHVGEILTAARNQLQELGAYKEEMREMVENIARKEATSPEDVEDCVAAANKMLESRGIEPIKIKGILKSQIRRLTEQKEQKEK